MGVVGFAILFLLKNHIKNEKSKFNPPFFNKIQSFKKSR